MANKAKILFMLQVPPPVHGAALRNKSLIESKEIKDNFNIKLLPINFADSIADIGKMSIKKIAKVIIYWFRLALALVSRPNAVYFTISPFGTPFLRDVFYVALVRLFGVKRIFHLRGLGIKKSYEGKFKKLLYDFAFKNAYVIILNNNQFEDVSFLPYKECFVVPNGMKDEASEFLNSNIKQESTLLYLSNYVKDKGALLFVDLVEALIRKGYNIKALMAGADADVTKIQIENLLTEKGIDENVEVNGPIFEKQKFELYAKASIFIFPSFIDLNPGVVIEAMQSKLPVVSTPIGGIPEIVDDNETGFIVPEITVKEFVAKTEILLNDSKLREDFGNNGRAKYLKMYNQESFENNIRDTFYKILQQ
ncbi:glycosyltransferase family 4 protein [Geojedonia litorea]|uniref:Glycosyltransferase family 4 protein n=1 Tax=Geojedonia litorea TaxID=1268269 RepID=A0ABV9N3K4_9FLAO